MKKKLNGQRNQCAACGEYFNSNAAFDKHRTGEFDKRPAQRRCMTVPEMVQRGMILRNDGFWVTEAMGEAWASKLAEVSH